MEELGYATRAARAEFRLRLLTLSRYPGLIPLEILVPLTFTAMPLLLGRAVSGGGAAAYFAENSGTSDYVPYLLVGATVYILVNRAFWDLGYWLRREQEGGTLEAIYLSPTHTLVLAAGVAAYSAARSLVSGCIAYVLGCLAFGVNPLTGGIPLAALFLLVGLVPLYGCAFLVVTLVLRVKESASLIGMLQWAASFLMGVFYPIYVLPPMLRAMAFLFPPTWLLNGARASILELSYFLGFWYLDLAVIWTALLLVPVISIMVFDRTERRLRANQGLGAF